MEEREPAGGDNGTGTQAPPSAAAFSGSERERELRRSDTGSVITGVCAGLGEYTRVDPVVWRTVFVMTALAGGTGLWLYLAAWILMRDPRGGPAMAEQFLNRRLASEAVLALLAAGLLAATALSLVGGFSWGTLVLATPLILGALAAHNRGVDLQRVARELPGLLKSSEPAPEPPPPDPTPTYYNPSDPWSATVPEGPVDLVVVAGWATDGTPLAGDPGEGGGTHGDEEDKGDGARRGGEHGCGHRKERGLSLLPFMLLAILASAGVALALAGGFSPSVLVGPVTGPIYLGSVVVIIGIALVVGTWFGDGRGLIALGTLGVVLAVGTATVDLTNMRFSGVTWRPDSVAELQRPYQLTAGSAVLDLSELPLEAGKPVSVNARVGFGRLDVRLPETALVELRGQVGIGEIEVSDALTHSGVRLDVRETLEPTVVPESSARGAGRGAGDAPPRLIVSLETYGGDVRLSRVSS